MYHYSFLIKEVRQTISLNRRHVALSLKEETNPKDFNKPKNGRGEWYNFLILNDEFVVKIKKRTEIVQTIADIFFCLSSKSQMLLELSWRKNSIVNKMLYQFEWNASI